MDVLTAAEVSQINATSKLVSKYSEEIDSNSAYEILTAKLEEATAKTEEAAKAAPAKPTKEAPSTFEKVANNTVVKSMLRTAGNGIVRGLLGALGLGGRSKKSKSSSWF